MKIQQEDNGQRGRYFVQEDGADIAEMVYSWNSQQQMIIHHTNVDTEYEGQGIARSLVNMAVEQARDQHFKIHPLCPYAKAVLTRSNEYEDILA